MLEERVTKREAIIKKLEEERNAKNAKRQNIDEAVEKIQDICFESEVETGTATQTNPDVYQTIIHALRMSHPSQYNKLV